MKCIGTLLLFFTAFLALTPVRASAGYILSTQNDAALGGLAFQEDDLVEYDPINNRAEYFFEWTGANENIDALHVLNSNLFAFSNTTDFSLDGQSFDYQDVILYDKSTGTASLFLNDRDVFRLAADIDAFSINDGLYYISTEAAEDLLTPTNPSIDRIQEGDLAVYDPLTGQASVLEIFGSAAENIDAVHVFGEDDILLSTTTAATLGTLSFGEFDLVRYKPSTGEASLFFDGTAFGLVENIDAVSVPIQSAVWLLGSGLVGLIGLRKKRGRG